MDEDSDQMVVTSEPKFIQGFSPFDAGDVEMDCETNSDEESYSNDGGDITPTVFDFRDPTEESTDEGDEQVKELTEQVVNTKFIHSKRKHESSQGTESVQQKLNKRSKLQDENNSNNCDRDINNSNINNSNNKNCNSKRKGRRRRRSSNSSRNNYKRKNYLSKTDSKQLNSSTDDEYETCESDPDWKLGNCGDDSGKVQDDDSDEDVVITPRAPMPDELVQIERVSLNSNPSDDGFITMTKKKKIRQPRPKTSNMEEETGSLTQKNKNGGIEERRHGRGNWKINMEGQRWKYTKSHVRKNDNYTKSGKPDAFRFSFEQSNRRFLARKNKDGKGGDGLRKGSSYAEAVVGDSIPAIHPSDKRHWNTNDSQSNDTKGKLEFENVLKSRSEIMSQEKTKEKNTYRSYSPSSRSEFKAKVIIDGQNTNNDRRYWQVSHRPMSYQDHAYVSAGETDFKPWVYRRLSHPDYSRIYVRKEEATTRSHHMGRKASSENC